MLVHKDIAFFSILMKKIILVGLILCYSLIGGANDKVCLKEGTRISVKITNEMSSQHYTNPNTIIASDVYDVDGDFILIKKGTLVEVQTKIQRASTFGDEGSIVFLPISTTAVDGREIVFMDHPISYNGQDALTRSRKKVKIAAGTAFAAFTANTYCFKKEKLEMLQSNQ